MAIPQADFLTLTSRTQGYGYGGSTKVGGSQEVYTPEVQTTTATPPKQTVPKTTVESLGGTNNAMAYLNDLEETGFMDAIRNVDLDNMSMDDMYELMAQGGSVVADAVSDESITMMRNDASDPYNQFNKIRLPFWGGFTSNM